MTHSSKNQNKPNQTKPNKKPPHNPDTSPVPNPPRRSQHTHSSLTAVVQASPARAPFDPRAGICRYFHTERLSQPSGALQGNSCQVQTPLCPTGTNTAGALRGTVKHPRLVLPGRSQQLRAGYWPPKTGRFERTCLWSHVS